MFQQAEANHRRRDPGRQANLAGHRSIGQVDQPNRRLAQGHHLPVGKPRGDRPVAEFDAAFGGVTGDSGILKLDAVDGRRPTAGAGIPKRTVKDTAGSVRTPAAGG